jgi:hypothetical protein
VVDHILTAAQVDAAQQGLSDTLARHGVDTNDLVSTGCALQKLSSTNGSGGVLDLFYDEWKMDVATNHRLFSITTTLWEEAYCHRGEEKEELEHDNNGFKWHPYGYFDYRKGYSYFDRVGYRLPTLLAEQLGAQLLEGSTVPTKKKKKVPAIQRSLTPHLDCCPETFYKDDDGGNPKSKWRPIQCFVSLTDNLQADTGGFEAARGFHRTFAAWATDRVPTSVTHKSNGSLETISFPAPCLGEYTHMRPKEDRDVMERVQHIPVKAGSAVFWDNRIPHANAYRHDGKIPRCVVYCSFLPDVSMNRRYAANQLENWMQGWQPTDQWINRIEDDPCELVEDLSAKFGALTPLGRRLLSIDPW